MLRLVHKILGLLLLLDWLGHVDVSLGLWPRVGAHLRGLVWNAPVAYRRDRAWVVEVVLGELCIQSATVHRIADDYFVLIVAVGQVVRVELEEDGKV